MKATKKKRNKKTRKDEQNLENAGLIFSGLAIRDVVPSFKVAQNTFTA